MLEILGAQKILITCAVRCLFHGRTEMFIIAQDKSRMVRMSQVTGIQCFGSHTPDSYILTLELHGDKTLYGFGYFRELKYCKRALEELCNAYSLDKKIFEIPEDRNVQDTRKDL